MPRMPTGALQMPPGGMQSILQKAKFATAMHTPMKGWHQQPAIYCSGAELIKPLDRIMMRPRSGAALLEYAAADWLLLLLLL